MPVVSLPSAHAAVAPATFVVQGSVEQLSVTHATPGASIALDDQAGHEIASGLLDAQGSFLFRDVPAASGYRAVQNDAGTVTKSVATKVLSPDFVPSKSFYTSQQLQTSFGYITMRDGTKLSATVKLPGPVEDGPYPTVVEYSGYSPSNPGSPQPSTLLAQLLGYATVGVNMRGTGCSGGSFTYFEQLQSLDGYDVIEAVAAQPWVARHEVGMVGISYPGISQLFVAQTRPPHLAAIAPLSVIADTFRSTLYPGGIFNNGFALSWGKDRQEGAKPYGQGWEHGIVDAGGPNGQQCAENQLLRLQNPDIVELINEHPYYVNELADPLAPITFVHKINVPVFLAGAWQDEQVGGESADMLDEFTSSPDKHFMFTNGTHIESLFAQLQRWTEFLDFYVGHRIPHVPALFRTLAPTVYQQIIGISGLTLPPDRFDDYPSYAAALAAYQAEPDVRILFENGYGDPTNPGAPLAAFEHGFSQWPPKETVPTTWYFQPDQRLSTKPPTISDGDGRAATSYVYDPTAKPATDYSGGSSAIWGANPTYDWRPLPLGKALAFDGPVLKHDVTMAGTGSVDLWLRSTAPDTDVEVTLTELRPDGQERYVQSGWLRASHRKLDPERSTKLRPWHTDLAEDAAPLPAGKFVKARVELFPFAAVFRAGSRLRITVEAPGGNRPFWTFDSIPATGTVINDIAHSVGHPSKVVLPVIPGIDAPTPLPPCPSLRGQPCRTTFGAATPIDVRAAALANGKAKVRWHAPATVRPNDTISSYTVREAPGGVQLTAPADATSIRFTGLATGPHSFTVEANYSGGGTSGVSTPSHTITFGSSKAVALAFPDARVGGLSFTGGDVMAVSLIGIGLLFVGFSLPSSLRRRQPSPLVDS